MTSHSLKIDPWKIITTIRYAFPPLLLAYFIVASTVAVCTLQTLSSKVKDYHIRRTVILWLMLGVVCEYLIHASLMIARSFYNPGWIAPPDEMVYLISSALIWGLQYVALLDSKNPVWYSYYANWIAAILVELVLLVVPSVLRRPVGAYDVTAVLVSSLRVCNFVILPLVYFAARQRKEEHGIDNAEAQPLLRSEPIPKLSTSGGSDRAATDYGATDECSDDQPKKKSDEEEAEEDFYFKRQRENEEKIIKRLKADGNWWNYCKGFFVFFPYIWPIHSKTLQSRALLTGACLLAENFLNILVPRQLGLVTDALVAGNGTRAWIAVATYSVLTFANSSACLGWLKFWLWQPIERYSYEALTAAAHAHVMSLSSEFHESREAIDIHQSISQGKGIRDIIDAVVFSIGPTFIDFFLALAYLYYLFGPYMALDIAATTFFYLYSTAKLVSLAANRRRTYHTYYRKEYYSSVSSVSNWRIASQFNQIPYEHSQHCANIKAQLRSQWAYTTLYNIIKVSQTFIMTVGLFGACFLAAYQVINKIRSPGDFVILLSYWGQLKGPMAILSNLYKTLSESLMDAERMLEIFHVKPKIADKDDAKLLKLDRGEIHFKNVEFAYDDGKGTLHGINLKIEGGSTIAIVGETGSGKSTILKLLQRFYDIKSGNIEIDGQDIREITLKSLRENIAIVPQEPTIFNETIMVNLRYAKLTATKDEIHDACKTAKIHDKIMSMPGDYNYKVGNSGIKLSGGEQQRIAIARAIVKQSPIILLDEATSSVDTETEQQIQEALNKLCQGRTTIIVAHRLSTVMRADCIVVMKDGTIIEHGSHENLLHLKGKYFDLWTKQIQVLNPKDKHNDRPNNEDNKPSGSQSQSPNKKNAHLDCSRARSKSPQKNSHAEPLQTASANPSRDHADSESANARFKSPHKNEFRTESDIMPEYNQVGILNLLERSRIPNNSQKTVDETPVPMHPKLKPNAPEFYPRHLYGDVQGSGFSASNESKQATKDRLKYEKVFKKHEGKVRKPSVFVAKRAVQNLGKQIGETSDIEEAKIDAEKSSSSATTENNQASTRAEKVEKNEKVRFRRPQANNRCHLSKSEHDGQDGANDSTDQLVACSREFEPLTGSEHTQTRQVSAPCELISHRQYPQVSSIGSQTRRQRHWRMRHRPGPNSGYRISSVTATSLDASTE